MFLVGTADEMAAVRDDATAYADDGGKWQPFRPEVCKHVRVLAAAAVAEEDLFPKILKVDDTLLDRLRSAEDRQSLVVLVVDPWTPRLPRLAPYLEQYDARRMINTEILVPWSDADEETAQVRDALLEGLHSSFYRTVMLDSSSLRDSITTAEGFKTELIAAIHEIRNRLIRVGKLRPVRGSETSGSLPLLAGPGPS